MLIVLSSDYQGGVRSSSFYPQQQLMGVEIFDLSIKRAASLDAFNDDMKKIFASSS